MQTLNFVPGSISVEAVAGASVSFSVSARKSDGSPFDLSGYAITAPIWGPPQGPAPEVTAFTVTRTDVGTVTLVLTATESETLGPPHVWRWCVWLDAGPSNRQQMVSGGLALHAP